VAVQSLRTSARTRVAVRLRWSRLGATPYRASAAPHPIQPLSTTRQLCLAHRAVVVHSQIRQWRPTLNASDPFRHLASACKQTARLTHCGCTPTPRALAGRWWMYSTSLQTPPASHRLTSRAALSLCSVRSSLLTRFQQTAGLIHFTGETTASGCTPAFCTSTTTTSHRSMKQSAVGGHLPSLTTACSLEPTTGCGIYHRSARATTVPR
jgi:hypothetical protein